MGMPPLNTAEDRPPWLQATCTGIKFNMETSFYLIARQVQKLTTQLNSFKIMYVAHLKIKLCVFCLKEVL